MVTCPTASQGRTEGEMVERMHVSGKVPGKTQWKFEERRRPGLCKATGSDENLIEDTDGMDSDRAIQYRILQYWRKLAEGQELCWHPVGNDAETRSLSRRCGYVQSEVRTHLGGRRID